MKHRHDPKMRDAERVHSDRLDTQATDAAVDAMVTDFKEIIDRNPAREVRTLRSAELRKIAVNAIGAFITRRSQQVTLATIDDLLSDGGQSPLQ